MLAAPLSLLAFLFDRALRNTDQEVKRLALSLEQLKVEEGDRKKRQSSEEQSLFRSIADSLSFDSLAQSLSTSFSRGYASPSYGIRVPFIYGQNHIRFRYQKRSFLRRARIVMDVEQHSGETAFQIIWRSNQDLRQFMDSLRSRVERGGNIPYDFEAAAPFQALSDLLVFTSDCKHNYRANAIESAQVIGAIDQWVFIDRGLLPMDNPHYCIGWERIKERDCPRFS